MKNKFVILSKQKANSWCQISNLYINSLYSYNSAIKQFNLLSSSDRIEIKKRVAQCDEIRRRLIPVEEQTSNNWIINLMVDVHIIATEYSIDPLTVGLCINPPCNVNQKVLVK